MTFPGASIEVRPATDADAAELAVLLSQLGYPADAVTLPARLARLRATGDDALVAVCDGAVAGLATLHYRERLHADPPVAQLTALVVHRDWRGRGIGKALVAVAERWARDLGAEALVVTTALHRLDAHAFYERLGYRHTGRRYVIRLAESSRVDR